MSQRHKPVFQSNKKAKTWPKVKIGAAIDNMCIKKQRWGQCKNKRINIAERNKQT